MHSINGLSLANAKTNKYLLDFKAKIAAEGPSGFLSMNDCIRNEYKGGKEVIVVPADMVFAGEMTLDLGGVTVKVVETEAPHTDDSTVVYVVEDKVLFLGDSTCGSFPGNTTKDKALCEKLNSAGAKTVILTGYWQYNSLYPDRRYANSPARLPFQNVYSVHRLSLHHHDNGCYW